MIAEWKYRGLPVRMILRAGRRVTKIELKAGEPILVKGNLRMTKHLAESFLNEKWNWVEKKYKELRDKTPPTPEQQLANAQKLLFLGEWISVRHTITPLRKAFLSVNEFSPGPREAQLYLPARKSLQDFKAQQILKDFYNTEARKRLVERVHYWSREMNLRPQTLDFRTMRSRWGSCSSKGRIALNSFLIKAPMWVCDSVIVHELAHLQHMNHSSQFWNLVERYSPEHLKADQWLKRESPVIF